MIAEALLAAAVLAQEPGLEGGPIEGDCSRDSASLALRASELLASAPPHPPASALARARELLRAARRGAASPRLDLFAADLAFLASDAEEGGDLLAAAADAGASLSPPELLLLARRAEERRRFREALFRYDALRRALAAAGETPPWLSARIRELELEAQAASIAPPPSGPPAEARLALADGKRALAQGRLSEAREKLQLALTLSPGYVEALLALSSLERRAGRAPAAIRAARQALSAEPDRFEALTALAGLLWEEPDRKAKEESLALLDRALALRPAERPLLRLSAERFAQLGDGSAALERLERYRAKATASEREATAPLQEALLRRVHGAEDRAPEAPPGAEEQASEAVDRYRKAQVYVERGDSDSLAAALALLSEAERLDPSLSRAPELAASILLRRGDRAQAERALRRALAVDASRASAHEELARLLDEDPARDAEAADAWRRAAEAGSTDAPFELARGAERRGRAAEALTFYRRYLDETPGGLHAAEARSAAERLQRGRVRARLAAGALGAGVLAVLSAALYRRSGHSFGEWLRDHPSQAPRVRPILGRLRHEVLKHGGLLLPDGALRLEETEAPRVWEAAELLCARLYGGGEAAPLGLVAEARAALSRLCAMAREDGVRLNLERRDPDFTSLARGLRALERAKPSLTRLASSQAPSRHSAARASRLLLSASRAFATVSASELERVLDRTAALPVRVESLQDLLVRVAEEVGLPAPRLEPLGALASGDPLPRVRVAPLDWETIWRNLFSNALLEGRARTTRPVRLGLSGESRRDPVTGQARLTLVLADDLSGALSAAALAARPAERGWGVIADLLRRNDGAFDVIPPPARGFEKGIALDLPAVEGGP